ncbi:hypothetical protein BCR41DRAFT_391584 [Lobosporangium transversale]|uniref:magnesium chelatase n=1 Tax=Lobosporangium transversale TaxID=64571 RepID=A0A1Y2H0R9_9FUNG|nr:hypothetical protein BCR41DRAFT_391584 [Lobosporangium transversale]ORZ28116.1 hypothetical protein BCR41DRAFT_391584 [Lobosporangium transversale]|eukprot:XP_021885801.1 hypothetical protein BCR41DRAFT_391584 [Lobosporangium transversale]
MAPANRAWIRSKMAAIRKASGIIFSEEIFLSMLICLIAKNKHLVLHTVPETVPELKAIVEQHSAVVFGLTTATIVCHAQQTRSDIIGAITGRHADISSSTPGQHSSHGNGGGGGSGAVGNGSYIGQHPHHHHYQNNSSVYSHPHTPSGQYYQYSNPMDEYVQRNAKLRFEKSRRSVATNYSEASDYSFRPHAEKNGAPSIASFRTASERDPDGGSIRRGGHHLRNDSGDYSRGGGDDSSMTLRRSESRSKHTGDAMADHIIHSRSRKSTMVHNNPDFDGSITHHNSINSKRIQSQQSQAGMSFLHPGVGTPIHSASGQTPVTPVDFTFPRRRHESVSNSGIYSYSGNYGYGYSFGGGPGGETSGATYIGRRIAQAIILEGLENASQEVYAILLEMINNKEINDKNRYMLPDLLIVAIFNSPNIPDNIPKQLLDYFAINGAYQSTTPQSRIQPVPARKHALFRRTEWDELSKRMKMVVISNDMMRYIRDVIVGVRTHEAVHGGLTARAALDLEAILRTLAAIFQSTFVTPDLVTIAADKVFSHRLELKSTRRRKMFASAICDPTPVTTSPSSPISAEPSTTLTTKLAKTTIKDGKLPAKGYGSQLNGQQRRRQRQRKHNRSNASRAQKDKGSSGDSTQSSDGGASFVVMSDSDDRSFSGSVVVFSDSEEEEDEEDELSSSDTSEEEIGRGPGIHREKQPKSESLDHDYRHRHAGAQLRARVPGTDPMDERTASDVVRDVLRAVYPPI